MFWTDVRQLSIVANWKTSRESGCQNWNLLGITFSGMTTNGHRLHACIMHVRGAYRHATHIYVRFTSWGILLAGGNGGSNNEMCPNAVVGGWGGGGSNVGSSVMLLEVMLRNHVFHEAQQLQHRSRAACRRPRWSTMKSVGLTNACRYATWRVIWKTGKCLLENWTPVCEGTYNVITPC